MADQIYGIVDFILNKASTRDLDVIRSALKRRYEGMSSPGRMGLNTQYMARETAANIEKQMGFSMENIRSVIQKYAVNIIRKNAPELSEAQIAELLEAWVSDPDKAGEKEKPDNVLPSDVLLIMIKQFISFSRETMTATEKARLEMEIPDWQKQYWNRFPPRIKRILNLYLQDSLDSSTCWEHIYAELGLEGD